MIREIKDIADKTRRQQTDKFLSEQKRLSDWQKKAAIKKYTKPK